MSSIEDIILDHLNKIYEQAKSDNDNEVFKSSITDFMKQIIEQNHRCVYGIST